MFWKRDPDPGIDEPTREELVAFDAFLRDREQFMRRTKQWESAWPATDLLESLHAKLRRALHRRSE